MLDQHDRQALAAELDERLTEAVDLDRVHPSGGLIEQQQRRAGRERAREFEPLLIAVGQAPCRLVAAFIEVEALEQRQRLLAQRPLGAGRHDVEEFCGRVDRRHSAPRAHCRRPSIRRTGAGSGSCGRGRRATIRCGLNAAIGSPRKRIAPRVGRMRPEIRLIVVVLPEPFGPMRPTSSPGCTANESSATALTPPNVLLSEASSSIRRSGSLRCAGRAICARPD